MSTSFQALVRSSLLYGSNPVTFLTGLDIIPMHLPTYLVLMISSVFYDLYTTSVLWQTNRLLFAAAVFITIATVAGGMLQLAEADNFEFMWMLWYVIPLGVLAVSGLTINIEIADVAMKTVGITPPAHIIPGTSQGYQNAATGHYLSMVFPSVAWLFSKFVQYAIDNFSRNVDA